MVGPKERNTYLAVYNINEDEECNLRADVPYPLRLLPGSQIWYLITAIACAQESGRGMRNLPSKRDTLDQRRRRWVNIRPAFGQRVVFAG